MERVLVGANRLPGDLQVPAAASAVVVFAHGSGSSRNSPRNRYVADRLNGFGLATLLIDLLTEVEDRDHGLRFDIALLASRLEQALDWLAERRDVGGLPIGLFGASTGAAAALDAAARKPDGFFAVVSRGGRPDLATEAFGSVKAPTLLIVGGEDEGVRGLNESVLPQLPKSAALTVVPGATHLFEEPGALEAVAGLAAQWFLAHLPKSARTHAASG